MGFDDERYDMMDSETGMPGMDQLIDEPVINTCENCGQCSEGKTEVQEWAGQELHYFCGDPCMEEWFAKWDKANREIEK